MRHEQQEREKQRQQQQQEREEKEKDEWLVGLQMMIIYIVSYILD